MAENDDRIYVDVSTGEEIESPDDAVNGSSMQYVGSDDIKRWREANPGKGLKDRAKSDNKAREKAETK